MEHHSQGASKMTKAKIKELMEAGEDYAADLMCEGRRHDILGELEAAAMELAEHPDEADFIYEGAYRYFIKHKDEVRK